LDGVLQVEACPFHSASLPGKAALIRSIESGSLLGTYAAHLSAFLHRRRVVIVSAIGTRVALSAGVPLSPWVSWLARLANLPLERAEFVPLVEKGTKTTAGALVAFSEGAPKSLVLMMGSNALPADAGLRRLADAMREPEPDRPNGSNGQLTKPT
jgi:hypothetical protein